MSGECQWHCRGDTLAATCQARMGIGEGERVWCSGIKNASKARRRGRSRTVTRAQVLTYIYNGTFTMVYITRLKMYNNGSNSYNNDASNVIRLVQWY